MDKARAKAAAGAAGKGDLKSVMTTVIVPVTIIPKSATFALFADPQGNCIGIVASQIPD